MSDSPQVVRVRHEWRRRKLSVARVESLPPNMIRVILVGEELEGFTSLGFDDHIKLFFPVDSAKDEPAVARGSAPPDAVIRDFTPRRFDAAAGELWVDFFVHDSGPAATWAAQATVGQTLEIGGPRGSAVISLDGIDGHVLIGDETALPAISRRLEELSDCLHVSVVIELDAGVDRPALPLSDGQNLIFVTRRESQGLPAQEIIEELRRLAFPSGRCFVWVALESRAARAVRSYLRNERGIGKHWIKAAGYWQRGASGAHETLSDDD